MEHTSCLWLLVHESQASVISLLQCKRYDEACEESIGIIDDCNDKAVQEVMAAILIQGSFKLCELMVSSGDSVVLLEFSVKVISALLDEILIQGKRKYYLIASFKVV